MLVTFLGADFPLVKSFNLVDGHLEKSPYPNAFLFTSHTHEIGTLEELHAQIIAAASKGQCLLKGEIKRQLAHESRAGATDAESRTQWVCLDIDGLQAYESIEEFMGAIGLGDVSYIVQYSASAGIEGSEGLRAHVFVLLSAPVAAPFLKQWLVNLNLSNSDLRSEIALTRTGNALRWPVDITTCQNDKLLYIAPPKLGKGVVDSFKGKRIALVKKKQATLPSARIKADINKNRADAKKLLNDLRKEAGYSAVKDSQHKVVNGIAYLSKPGEAVITGIKDERDFVYFNLNGGDSWGYYHPADNPEFIYNFKGEPTYKTEELLPDYWKSVSKVVAPVNDVGRKYFVLRDFKTDRLYNGYFDRETDELTIAKAANETRLRSFLKQHGQPVPDFVPDWDLTYDPTSNARFDEENRIVNLYVPSPYYALSTRCITTVPKTIDKIIESAVGTGEVKEHFLNWLAFIIQTRRKTGTAWVLHGNQGTGKGILFHQIIAPLLGQRNVHNMLMDQLESQFNGWIETAQVVFVDEVQLNKLTKNSQVNGNLKSYITEPIVPVRRMHSEVYRASNFTNFIFASNTPDPVNIEVTDRRYNVGMFQAQRLKLSVREFNSIATELENFYMFLQTYKVDENKAHTVLETEDRKLLISINRTSVDEVADALIGGDLEYLIDQFPSSDNPVFQTPGAIAYRQLIERFIQNGHDWKYISRDELFTIYDYCVGGVPNSPNKFTAMLKHHRLYTRKVRRGDDVFMGVGVKWKQDDEWFADARKKYCVQVTANGKVMPIKKAKVG